MRGTLIFPWTFRNACDRISIIVFQQADNVSQEKRRNDYVEKEQADKK